jgi:hypothetical protein
MRILQCLYSAHTKTGCCTRTITPEARDTWLSFITQSPLPISLEPHQSWRIALTLSHAFDLILLLIRTHQAPYSAGLGIRSLRTSAGLVSLSAKCRACSFPRSAHAPRPPTGTNHGQKMGNDGRNSGPGDWRLPSCLVPSSGSIKSRGVGLSIWPSAILGL